MSPSPQPSPRSAGRGSTGYLRRLTRPPYRGEEVPVTRAGGYSDRSAAPYIASSWAR